IGVVAPRSAPTTSPTTWRPSTRFDSSVRYGRRPSRPFDQHIAALYAANPSNCQDLWMEDLDYAALAARVVALGRSMSLPRSNRAPARTRATRWGALTARQRCWAASMSLKAMARPAAFEPGPLVTLVRRRTVAKVDSIGLVVRRCTQCSH